MLPPPTIVEWPFGMSFNLTFGMGPTNLTSRNASARICSAYFDTFVSARTIPSESLHPRRSSILGISISRILALDDFSQAVNRDWATAMHAAPSPARCHVSCNPVIRHTRRRSPPAHLSTERRTHSVPHISFEFGFDIPLSVHLGVRLVRNLRLLWLGSLGTRLKHLDEP